MVPAIIDLPDHGFAASEDGLNAIWETFGQQLEVPTFPDSEDRASVSNVLPFRLTSTWRHPSFSALIFKEGEFSSPKSGNIKIC